MFVSNLAPGWPRWRATAIAQTTIAVGLVFVVSIHCAAQSPSGLEPPQPTEPPTTAPATAESIPPSDSPPPVEASEEDIQRWIETLGSSEFAMRERAATHLMELGTAIVPPLRQLAANSDDPEVRIRAAEIVKQLTRGDLMAQDRGVLGRTRCALRGMAVRIGVHGRFAEGT